MTSNERRIRRLIAREMANIGSEAHRIVKLSTDDMARILIGHCTEMLMQVDRIVRGPTQRAQRAHLRGIGLKVRR